MENIRGGNQLCINILEVISGKPEILEKENILLG